MFTDSGTSEKLARVGIQGLKIAEPNQIVVSPMCSAYVAVNVFTSNLIFPRPAPRNGGRASLGTFLLPKCDEHQAAHVPPGPGQAAEGHEELRSGLQSVFPDIGGQSSRHLLVTKPTKCECVAVDFDIFEILSGARCHLVYEVHQT